MQSILKAVGVPCRACGLVPQVVQAYQVCRPWKRPGQSNKLSFSLALSFDGRNVQFDYMFYKSLLEFGFGGEQGIAIVHLMDCCIRWSACRRTPTTTIRGLLGCMSVSWINVFGGMKTSNIDGETGMKGKEVDDWCMCGQVAIKHKAPHQKAWLVERHDAPIRSTFQRAGSQVARKLLCVSSTSVLGLVTFMHEHQQPHPTSSPLWQTAPSVASPRARLSRRLRCQAPRQFGLGRGARSR